jgi:probable rRNA maturation factor
MINLQINDAYLNSIHESTLTGAAQAALANQSAPQDADLTIVITGDEEIRELNQQFLDTDTPTDVLSFPATEVDPETGHIYLGDIMISYPRAVAQANQGLHSVEQEVQLLVVHGVLHLMGHDHADGDEKEKMWAAQAIILHGLGNPLTNPY